MADYRMRDVERMLGVSRRTILAFVRNGFVSPARGARNAYAFTFEDLVVLRIARDMVRAAVPASRIARSLRRVRSALRDGADGETLRIAAAGDRIVLRRGTDPWQADTGQYLLELWVAKPQSPAPLQPTGSQSPVQSPARSAMQSPLLLHEQGDAVEAQDPARAVEFYRRALSIDPGFAPAAANLGRCLHEQGRLDEATGVYRQCLAHRPDPLVHYNHGVLLEDLRAPRAALEQYEAALRLDPAFADCHYNASLVLESLGDRARALRHLRAYRRLVSGPG